MPSGYSPRIGTLKIVSDVHTVREKHVKVGKNELFGVHSRTIFHYDIKWVNLGEGR